MASWSKDSINTASWSKDSINTTAWNKDEIVQGVILLENNFTLLQENEDYLLTEAGGDTSWAKQSIN